MRLFGVSLRTPFTGGADALRWAGRDGGADALRDLKVGNFETADAGCAKEMRRFRLILSLRYLKIEDTEEICGRFGSFDEQTTAHISRW